MNDDEGMPPARALSRFAMPKWVARLQGWRARRWVGVGLASLVGYVVVHELTTNYVLPQLRSVYLDCFSPFFPRREICTSVVNVHRILPPMTGVAAVGFVFLFAVRLSLRGDS